jgi:tetratricopeptide (TPR) repeat protein
MGLSGKIKGFLEHKISLGLNTKISKKKAVALVITFAVLMSLIGYFIGGKIFWSEDSRSLFDRQIEVLKDTVDNHNINDNVDLAVAYYLKGDFTAAQVLFREILKQDKNNAAANIYYGLILADSKNYGEAIPYLSKGIAIDPRREKLSFLYLGISYYQVGDIDKALQYLTSSTKINSGSSVAYYYLGLVYEKKNDFVKARTALQKALSLSGNNYQEAENELEKLPKQSNK